MNIYGFNKTTLLDYPEHVAATVFTGGCNFRCPFCQNAGLVLCPAAQPLIPEEEVLAHLEKRKGILDGLCITGGEPTLSSDLEEFIRKVRDLGYLVKLDTNGYRPEVLERLLEQGLLDYVAMDIKASRENYEVAAGLVSTGTTASATGDADTVRFDLARIEQSVELLKNGDIPYEFRTTVVKGIHRAEEFEGIGKWLAGCRAYFIQSYEEIGEILARDMRVAVSKEAQTGTALGSFTAEELGYMALLAGKHIDRVELRGI